MQRVPNVLLIGGGRSGTTSIFHHLASHPEIFVPRVKEPHFLTAMDFNRVPGVPRYLIDRMWTPTAREYLELFRGSEHYPVVAEASVGYFYYYKETIPRIKDFLGDPTVIILLRDPATRAYSHFLHNTQHGHEQLSFRDALRAESERVVGGWWWGYHYKKAGHYLEAVRAYKNNFSTVRVVVFEDFRADPARTMTALFDLVGVDTSFRPPVEEVHNASKVIRFLSDHRGWASIVSRAVNRAARTLPAGVQRLLHESPERMDPQLRERLDSEYRFEWHQLESTAGCRLSRWGTHGERKG